MAESGVSYLRRLENCMIYSLKMTSSTGQANHKCNASFSPKIMSNGYLHIYTFLKLFSVSFRSLLHPLAYSFNHSLILSLNHTHSLILSLTHTDSSTHPPSLTHSLYNSLAHSINHPITLSLRLPRTLTHSLTQSISQSDSRSVNHSVTLTHSLSQVC